MHTVHTVARPGRRAFLTGGSALAAGALLGGALYTAVPRSARAAVLPDVNRFTGAARARIEGGMLVVQTSAVPDHGSPYFEDGRYEAFSLNRRFHRPPNRIVAHDLVLRIPLNPVVGGRAERSPMGPMGVALNGIPFFNQFAGGGAPLSHEIVSFDQYNGHPTPFGMYHYHVEPLALTRRHGRDALLGYLLDGFPVYGPMENGRLVANADLDECHGHAHATRDYPGGIYHYHTTEEAPYIAGVGLRGRRGGVAALNGAGVEVAYIEPVVCGTPAA